MIHLTETKAAVMTGAEIIDEQDRPWNRGGRAGCNLILRA